MRTTRTAGRGRRTGTWAAAAVLALGAALGGLQTGAAAAASSCAVTWGSLDKTTTSSGSAPSDTLAGVRAGHHTCYDRLVLDVAGDGWARVRYVPAVSYQARDGSIPLRGGAFLEIITNRVDDVQTGAVAFQPADPSELAPVASWPTLRQVAYGGSFEGQTTVGVGVRARLPFRLFGLPGPGSGSRLVLDVAHRW